MKLKLEKARVDSWTKRRFFEGTSAKLGPSLDHSGRPVTGLSTSDETKFEIALGLPKGTLSKNSKYWSTFMILVDSDGSYLEDDIKSNPEDALKVKFLKAQSIVAFGSGDLLKKPRAEYLLYSDEQEKVVKNKERKEKRKANTIAGDMDISELKGMVLMYGHNPKSMSEDAIEDFVFEKVEQDPKTFMMLIEDPQKETKVFVHSLVKEGIIEVRGGAYMYEGEPIAYGLDSTAIHLGKKENQEQRIALEKRLSAK